MAYRVSNISPIDLQPRVAIGISLPFNGTIGFNSTYTTSQQLKTNIISFLLTNKGERLFQPNEGANLRRFIFEQQSDITLKDLKEIFNSKLETKFPQIKISNVEIVSENYNINISFSYQVINTNIQDNIIIAIN